MKYNIISVTVLCTLSVGISSCSSRLATVAPPPQTLIIPQDFGNLFPTPELAFADFQSIPVIFQAPEIIINEPFNEPFTEFEQNQVRVKNDKLFDQKNEIQLDLSRIPRSNFSFPLAGARIISPYGTRRGRNHTGIDLKTHANDTVRVAFDGIVRVANRGRGYGNVIVVRHYNGIETVYSHNSKHLVKSGDRIVAGTPIALVGRTGRATTEHVHFETRINGQCFDPNLIIDFQTQKLQDRCIVFTPDSKGSIRINQV